MRWTVDVPGGEIPILADDEARPAVVVLAHGAGSHMEHRTMEWLAGLVLDAGARVVRFDFLYRVQGRSMPDRMAALMAQYRAVIASVREELRPERLIIGGHSMGGRVASMVEAEGRTADGLLLFSYPLHPPGQPEKLRDAHLAAIRTPTLQLNGTEDEFCTRDLMERVLGGLDASTWRLHWLEGAGHSYAVRKSSGRTRKDVEAEIRREVGAFLGST